MIMIPQINKYLYAHKESYAKEFFFPLTGITITTPLKIGKTEIIPISLVSTIVSLPQNMISNISCIAKTTVDVSEKWHKLADNYSIALQLTRQCIGALYLAIYNTKNRCDDSRRIIISNIGLHELDEGLVICKAGNEVKNYVDISKKLFFNDSDMNDTFLRNLETINFQMIKYYQNDNEFGNKILKSLEIIYCINNEIYSNERILKICATLNMLFKDNSGKDIDSNWIASQLNQLFNYYNIKIKEKIPKELMAEEMLKTKYTTLFIDNYKKIRNNFMHGIIDLYQEFTVINTTDYLFYIISLYELLNILITFPNFNSLTTTDAFITKIKNNNKHYKNNKTVPPMSSDA